MLHPRQTDAEPARCPVTHAAGQGDQGDRLVTELADCGPDVERTEKGWIVRSAHVAREILREGEAARQAGFSADAVREGRLRIPLLYNYGENHRVQRSNLARFFAPKIVDTRYRGLMKVQVDRALEEVTSGRAVNIDDVSMRFSVGVAREVVGLTNSSVEGLSRRLDSFFGVQRNRDSRLHSTIYRFVSLAKLGVFHVWDVRPAVRARRVEPQDDVISYLVKEGLNDAEILMECIVYAAAGMVTTREFISLALWHFLKNPKLREEFLAADQDQRYAILYEMIRVDPIVVNLFRTMADDVTVSLDGQEHTFAAGDRVDIKIRATNADTRVVGECPVTMHPGRSMPRGYKADVLSFGEGPHRCPGAFLAMQESDMLLQELLKLNLEVVREPQVTVDPIVEALVLRGLQVRAVA